MVNRYRFPRHISTDIATGVTSLQSSDNVLKPVTFSIATSTFSNSSILFFFFLPFHCRNIQVFFKIFQLTASSRRTQAPTTRRFRTGWPKHAYQQQGIFIILNKIPIVLYSIQSAVWRQPVVKRHFFFKRRLVLHTNYKKPTNNAVMCANDSAIPQKDFPNKLR